MIDFKLAEEQQTWQKKARDFVEGEVKAVAWEIDQNPDIENRFSRDLYRKMGQEGIAGACVPREYGGEGLSILTLAIIIEELAAGDAGVAFTCGTNAWNPLQIVGTEEQKRRFLPMLYDKNDPKLTAFALTEANAGSDPSNLQTVANLEGNEYVINGSKSFISSGGIAGIYVIFAITDRSKGARGISAFIAPGDTPGLSRGRAEDKMGLRTSHTARLSLDDVRVPKENLLGNEGEGLRVALRTLGVPRTCVGAIATGVARAAYEAALKFAKERVSLSSADQQIVSFTLADMLASIEATRLMTWKTCWLIDNNLPFATESALTKFLSSDMAVKVTAEAAQIVGIHAYTREYPVEKYMRDAKILQIFEGTNQITRLVVARQLAG